ncbi:MAG: FAD-dependent oxidoreductase [Candidatus Marinimicrobia bacterium]|nr:FAD-dependent oxidoreductase [Candidatus Neomarinimicrobiota bacterium]
MKYDTAIIGAGISGASVANALSRCDLSVCVLEKSSDVSSGASKANSGIVHAGYDAESGTMMARFNVEGNALYPALCRRLDVPFLRCGSYVLAFDDAEVKTLGALKRRGETNGVPGLEILPAEALRRREARISRDAVAALYAPGAGIVSPYELVIALMENAMDNGTELFTEFPVRRITREDGSYTLHGDGGTVRARSVINCAGVHADSVHNLLLEPAFAIRPRRGEYYLLDKYAGDIVRHVIFQCPTRSGKGVLVAPTAHGNILVGPNAQYVTDKEAVETTAEGLSEVWKSALRAVPELPRDQVITTFSGIRAQPSEQDFIIRDYENMPGFIDVAGIKSPGLSAAPAFALYVRKLLKKYFPDLKEKEHFRERRKKVIRFHTLSHAEREALVRKDPRYGRIVCRCESITEGEIVDAIHRNAGAVTLDGVKRRARCGGGRCQGGFCGPRILEILSRETGVPANAVRKDERGSEIVTGMTKGEDVQ